MIRHLRLWPLAVVGLLIGAANTAQTAANTVTPTRAVYDARTAGPNDLKPDDCASITVTEKVNDSGLFSGTSAAELITGGTGGDVITAGGGDDCVIGGAGNDTIDGGSGNDVCLGGRGNDTFLSCEIQIQ